MKLLIENIRPEEIEPEILTEGGNGKRHYYLKGPFLQCEVKNRNGRVYPSNIIEREVQRFYEEKINKNMAGMELNHPSIADVNPERICAYVTELKKEGTTWYGKAKVASTTLGKHIIMPLIEDGYRIGVSSRGIGEVGKNGIVTDSYKLITCDLVSSPSAPLAFLDPILEQKEYIILEDGRIAEKAYANFEKKLEVLPKDSTLKEEHLAKAVKEFLRSIR